jgi:hypothetical protein
MTEEVLKTRVVPMGRLPIPAWIGYRHKNDKWLDRGSPFPSETVRVRARGRGRWDVSLISKEVAL